MKVEQLNEELAAQEFKMEKLAYGYGDLEPALSTNEVKYHYLKHTKKYFEKVNELTKGTSFARYPDLISLIQSKVVKLNKELFNQAAQAQNHTFYWKCLTKTEHTGTPSPQLMELINKSFKSLAAMKDQFNEAGAKQFGSGWAWLVLRGDKLVIETTADAQTPFSSKSGTPLLCIDVWEHAYTYDPQYVGDRKKYLKNIWKIINWTFVSSQLTQMPGA